MKYSLQFSDAIHILAYLDIFAGSDRLASADIAGSIETNPTRVRRIMAALKQAGLITTQAGSACPHLTKPTNQITFADVYAALDEPQHIIPIDEKTNPDCPVGANIQAALDKQYQRLDAALNAEMQQITLAEVLKDMPKV
ncbi:Rrf2 family transcriptional regulator [Eupransor demetentiae]|uniref:IscR family (IscR) n=1 Tax=Eupransor demetentiae TaxID=3109584 RepID=A0ABP0EQ73_9LACO|nr:DNA-binding transcriptional regulator [Lactobacillaceae bacterium LMG 33000]